MKIAIPPPLSLLLECPTDLESLRYDNRSQTDSQVFVYNIAPNSNSMKWKSVVRQRSLFLILRVLTWTAGKFEKHFSTQFLNDEWCFQTMSDHNLDYSTRSISWFRRMPAIVKGSGKGCQPLRGYFYHVFSTCHLYYLRLIVLSSREQLPLSLPSSFEVYLQLADCFCAITAPRNCVVPRARCSLTKIGARVPRTSSMRFSLFCQVR